jgi:hypothetical protein
MRFAKYYNHESGNRNIYSREDLLKMTLQDMLNNELPISYQYNTIGIPLVEELNQSPNVCGYLDENGAQKWSADTTLGNVPEEQNLLAQNSLPNNVFSEEEQQQEQVQQEQAREQVQEQEAQEQAREQVQEQEAQERQQEQEQQDSIIDENDVQPVLEGYVTKEGKPDDDLKLWQKGFDKLLKSPLARFFYPAAANMYTDARTGLSRAQKDPNVNVLENMSQLDDETRQKLLNSGIPSNERGVYYNDQSTVSNQFAKSEEIKDFFKKNELAIKRGEVSDANFDFEASLFDFGSDMPKADRFASLQHAKLINPYIDEKGNYHGQLIDNYDFEHRDDDGFKTKINNFGYDMQSTKKLDNYFSIIDFCINNEDLDEDKKHKKMR